MLRTLSFLLLSFPIAQPAFGYATSIHDSTGHAREVKEFFLREAQRKGSPIRKAVDANLYLTGETLEGENVAVVQTYAFNYTGKENSDGSYSPDEHDSSYSVFVGFATGGRGSESGVLRFDCRISFRGDNYLPSRDLRCGPVKEGK